MSATLLQLMREIEEKDERLATVESELESFKICNSLLSSENERLKKRVEQLQRNFSNAAKDGQVAMDAVQRMEQHSYIYRQHHQSRQGRTRTILSS